jgi:hypothetical protein
MDWVGAFAVMSTLRLLLCCIGMAIASSALAQIRGMEFFVDDRIEMVLFHGQPAIFATGRIHADTAKRFEALLSSQPQLHGSHLYLSSPGGNLSAGMEMGRVIRKYNLQTRIGKYSNETWITKAECFSACAYAYLGGRFRYFLDGDSFGVHQFYHVDSDIGSISQTQFTAGKIIDYLVEMGVNPQIFSVASRAASDELILFSKSDMFDWQLANNGELVVKAEYRVGQGHPYLVIEQDYHWGTGKITLTCGSERVGKGVMLAFVMLGKEQAARLHQRVTNSYFELDGAQFWEMPVPTPEVWVQNVSLMTMRGIDREFLEALIAANSLAVWFDDQNEIHRNGFTLQLHSVNEKLRDFLGNCAS